MNGDRFLIDTNILLYLTGKRIPAADLPEGEFSISFITELEILSYPSLRSEEEISLNALLAEIPIVHINEEIKKQTIVFRKKYNLKLPDAIIAATAAATEAVLITNDKQFASVREIKVISIPPKNI